MAAQKESASREQKTAVIEIIGVTEPDVLENVRAAVRLYNLLEKGNLKYRLRDHEKLVLSASNEIKSALKPYGYYNADVELSSGWRESNAIGYQVNLGQPMLVQELDVQIKGPAQYEPELTLWRQAYPLKLGGRLVQPLYDQAKQGLLNRLRQLGYFDAKFEQQVIAIDLAANSAAIKLHLSSGQRFRFGETDVIWLGENAKADYTDSFTNRYISIEAGEYYDDRLLQRMQSVLSGSGYFSAAQVQPALDHREGQRVPIQVQLDAPKRYSYGASVGFGTDTGPRAGASLEDRRINRRAHNAQASVSVSDIRATVVSSYQIPQKNDPRSGVRLFASLERDQSDTRDSTKTSLGIDLSRSLGTNGQASLGISYQNERFNENGVDVESDLLVPKLSWQTVRADNVQNPKKGFSLSATVLGASDELASDLSFLQFNLDTKIVYELSKNRFLARLNIGQTLIDDEDVLPESFSYLAGGDYSVRGYSFESIGVVDDLGQLQGGDNTVSASVELERRVWRELSLATFVDAGDAYDQNIDLNVGFGVGARWRLPFGAIKLDLAQAQDLPGKPVRFHFTFGADL